MPESDDEALDASRWRKSGFPPKKPLEDIVDTMMIEKGFSLENEFDHGLPDSAHDSSTVAEHSISFKPKSDEEFDAEVEYYFGIGGMD